ncbi:MAG: hypothetical protein ACXWRZ_18945 [Bdellovibrio sp.]
MADAKDITPSNEQNDDEEMYNYYVKKHMQDARQKLININDMGLEAIEQKDQVKLNAVLTELKNIITSLTHQAQDENIIE